MKKIFSLFLRLFVWFKYKNKKLFSEGVGCSYKFWRTTFSYPEKITFSDNVHIGPGCNFDAAGGISIGNGSILAPEVIVYSRTHNFDSSLKALPFDNVMLIAPVVIGNYVWIGARAIILPGVYIGDGAVIGAGAVIAKDVPSGAVVVGNPGRIVRYRNKQEFDLLNSEIDSFVYTKLGHGKIFKNRFDYAAKKTDLHPE